MRPTRRSTRTRQTAPRRLANSLGDGARLVERTMRIDKAISIILFLGLVTVGCATTQTQDMLNSRLGLMTYEEALQRFGPPTQCAEAGSTKTCVWVYGSGGTVFAPIGKNVVAIPTQAPTARLTFNNGVLSNWQLNGNWK